MAKSVIFTCLTPQCFSDKICCAFFVFSSTLILGERGGGGGVNLSESMLEIRPWPLIMSLIVDTQITDSTKYFSCY